MSRAKLSLTPRTTDYLVSRGERLSAQDALAIDLVTEVVPADRLGGEPGHPLGDVVGHRHLRRRADEIAVARVMLSVHRGCSAEKEAAVVTPTGFEPATLRLGI